MPPLGPSPQADVTTPEKEESLLSPMRIPGDKETPKKSSPANLMGADFDPLSLSPDHVHVECEVGPSVLILYGSLLKIIINLKVLKNTSFAKLKLDLTITVCVNRKIYLEIIKTL